jgi:hypothetical protein
MIIEEFVTAKVLPKIYGKDYYFREILLKTQMRKKYLKNFSYKKTRLKNGKF